ncbi:MAG: VWA domain-containing protein [Pyrinomonadaceae bacterium]
MKNLLVLFLVVCGVFVFRAAGQTTTTVRPRVAPTALPRATPTPASPTLGNDLYRGSSQGGPPVLSGGRNRPTSSDPTPTPQTGDDDNGVIRIETNLVTMPVSVIDRDGRFISGLQKNDFKIFENGTEQKVDYFQSVEQPFTVILLIDVSPSTQFKIDEIQNAAITFVDQLRPGDRLMVVSFDENVHILSPVTSNRNVLRNAIQQAQFGDGTGLYEAVDYVLDQQLRQIEGRKAVVIFTDGVDTTSRRATYASTLRKTEEIDALFYTIRYDTSREMMGSAGGGRRRSNGVSMADVLGAILMGGGGSINMGGGYPGANGVTGNEYAIGKKYLELLAQNSGGRQFEAQSMYNLTSAFSGIAEELRRQYSLGYYPDNVGRLGDRKQIKIRVMRPNVMVRAKNSYIVGQSDRGLAGR